MKVALPVRSGNLRYSMTVVQRRRAPATSWSTRTMRRVTRHIVSMPDQKRTVVPAINPAAPHPRAPSSPCVAT